MKSFFEEYPLKIDKKFPHHYIIGVKANDCVMSTNRGEIYLKYGPLYFTNEDVENLQKALALHKDKMLPTKTPLKECLNIYNVSWLLSLNGMQLAAKTNNCTLHHFTTEIEMDDQSFVDFVKLCNTDKYSFQMLMKARIG